MRRCPPLVFTRLRAALADFVIERAETGGATVLCYYHRQFWEAAERRYLAGGARVRLLGLLADRMTLGSVSPSDGFQGVAESCL